MNNLCYSSYAFADDDVRDMLQNELEQYEVKFDKLKPYERKQLRKWVACGNSAYDNPYLFSGDDGFPMDYISAIRLAEDMKNDPDGYTCCSALVPETLGNAFPF